MRLESAQRRHLLSAYATVQHYLRLMEEAAGEGCSPTGVGSPLTPLPHKLSEEILHPLRTLQDELRQELLRRAPEELLEHEQPQGLSNSLVWMSNLLEHIRQAVDGLTPARLRKYGALTTDQRNELAALHGELAMRVQQARTALEKQA